MIFVLLVLLNVIGFFVMVLISGLVIIFFFNFSDFKECSGSRKVRVFYDYDVVNSIELLFLVDEVIIVFSVVGMDLDWLMGERGN